MAFYKIVGAHKDTAEPKTLTLMAIDEIDAREQASKMGILIETIERTSAPLVSSTDSIPAGALHTTFAVILFIIGAGIAFFEGTDATGYYIPERFQRDNAIGATANALEEIERMLEQTHAILFGGLLILIAIAFQLFSWLKRIHALLEDKQ